MFNKRNKLSKSDLRLVSDLNAAMQQEQHRGLAWSITLLAIFMGVFIFWAYNSQIEEVTRGQGSIVPSSRQQEIQSLDAGLLKTLHVKEGDLVDKGDILITIDDTRSSAVLRETAVRVANLQAILSRYRAEAYGTDLVFIEEIPKELQDREKSAYVARKRSLDMAVKGMRSSKKILDEQIYSTGEMVKRGVSSKIELLRMQRESTDLEFKISERQNQYISSANDELVKTESELAQAKESLARNADPVERAKVRSPVRGIVNNIKKNTIGGVISAGEDIMEIIPVDEALVVQAYISPLDVAFISVGQKALVKITSYDFGIYGGLEGKVTLISPDTLSDERRPSELNLNASESYYRVLIETNDNKQLTDKNGNSLPIMPGMVASVDIKTGSKSVFDYLSKPLRRMKQALQER